MKSISPSDLVIGLVAIALAAGWLLNIGKVLLSLDGDVTAMFIARIVGVFFAPLGGVLGWL